ncbi:MAG: HEAT repeat domain-containing protein [Bdellovibrionales bacterium]|nr:HEAT repeat domain-containing protein [Bdellovibrionales bacterium]
MMRSMLFVGLVTLLLPLSSNAAVPKRLAEAPIEKGVLAILELPLASRMKALRAAGPAGYKSLRTVMFDPKSKIETRWRATMAIGRLGGRLSLPELERAKAAEVWELRSASLLAVARFDRETAAKWARELLKDKALLVRLSAVQTIQNLDDRTAIPYLWAQLESQHNFKRGQSLFIRRRIVEALSRLEGKGAESKFVALLEDKDGSLYEPSIQALERITGQAVGRPGDQMTKRRAMWQQWWSARRVL